ncbi:oligosaccharide flippase family protein [Haloarcula regularis]|uniref:oligosaccharide flippase family protein n=1 Tax=Haloarcula regularis TaxID=3033392 RepID=UPI0023E8014B|nr:polysaccharide biosynthesis C-terminal domain-containing protein [Halomicroarcula sp. SYNS111]
MSQSISIEELIRQPPSTASIRKFLTFSWPLAFSSSFVLLMSQLDILMIGVFLSSREVGLYRAVQPLKEVVLFFLTSFVFLYLPIATEYYAGDRYSDLRDLYLTSTKWIVTVTFPIVLTSVLFANDIIRILFGKSYTPASTAFAILVIGMFTRVIVGPNGATIQAINRSEIEMYASLLGMVVNVGFNIMLIPLIGIKGAAIATSFGFIFYNLIEIVVIYRDTGIVPISMTIVTPIIPTIIIGSVSALVLRHWTLDLPLLMLITILLGLLHVGSVIITRNLEEKDLLLLKEIEENTSLNLSRIRVYLEQQIDKR